jgi:hypothetical protein
MVDTMTARQFLESSWFKLLWRGVIVLGIPALSCISAYAGYTLKSVYDQQATLTASISTIKAEQAETQETLADRAAVNDDFQTEIRSDVAVVDGKVEKLTDAMSRVQLDVARIVGIVTEMQRRDVAERYIPQ